MERGMIDSTKPELLEAFEGLGPSGLYQVANFALSILAASKGVGVSNDSVTVARLHGSHEVKD